MTEYRSLKQLPKKYRTRPRGKVFRVNRTDGFIGSKDILIEKQKECKKCKTWLRKDDKSCTACQSVKIQMIYLVHECSNTTSFHGCTVNRWGCSIHFKERQCSFTCTCDRCY